MKKVYQSLPESNAVVEKELRRLSARLGVETPTIKFWKSGLAKYEPDENTIYIHDTTWAQYVDPDCSGVCFWGGVVLHEFAHYLDHIWNDQIGHTPEMYAILIGLNMAEGLDLETLFHHEKTYRPGSLSKGSRLAGPAILSQYKGAIR